MRHPLRRRPRRRLFQHTVYLLEGKPFGLRDEEVCECEGNAAEAAPHEEDFGAEVGIVLGGADEVGGYDGNDLVGVSTIILIELISK